MLKLCASYSKKVRGSEEFSSEGYLCALELELPDRLEPAELDTQIHDTFALARTSVEAQLQGNPPSAAPPAHPGGNGNGKASNRQLKYLLDLACDRGIELGRLQERLAEQYGARSVYDLTRQQASEVLDDLTGNDRQLAA